MKQVYSRICVLACAAFSFATSLNAQVSANISSQTNVSCNGGNNGVAVAAESNGVGPFSFIWMPGNIQNDTAASLIAGSYTVTVTDSSDMSTATASVTITEPAALTASHFQTNNYCYNSCNGSVTLTVNGGTPAYSYSWAPSGGTGVTASSLCSGSYTATITDALGCSITQSATIMQPTQLTLVITSQTNVTCNGGNNGSLTAMPSGGTPAYTYSWAPSGGTTAVCSNLVAGCYTCTVTDMNGCTAIASSCITQPPPMSFSITPTAITCNATCNGSATCSFITGGMPPYSYNWSPNNSFSPNPTNLCAGTYTCTVTDANGCTAANLTTITQPPPFNQSVAASSGCTACIGTATVTATGGVGPYIYSWSPSVSSTNSAATLCDGNYSVTTTDQNGCSGTSTFAIANGSLALNMSSTPEECNANGTAYCIPTGTAPFTYSWQPGGQTTQGIIGVAAGSYTVTVTDACSNSATASVTVGSTAPPTATILSITNATCASLCNGSIHGTVSGGTAPYTYQWTPVFQSSSIATNLCPGTYTFTATDANGCTSTTTATITATNAVNVAVTSYNTGCSACTGAAMATPTTGQSPFTYNWSNSFTVDSISNLCVGNYTVTVTDATGCSGTGTATIGANTGFVATASSTPANCWYNFGTATISMSGGLPPYTYLWTPTNQTTSSISGAPGVYHVIVGDQSGCYTSVYDTIHAPPMISSYITTHPTDCNAISGSAVVHASGGVTPLTYLWSNSSTNDTVTNLPGGNYSVTITDAHGCTNSGYTTVFTTCDDIIMGNVYKDPNMNCVFDAGDQHLPYVYLYTAPGYYNTVTDAQGNYMIRVPAAGTYTVYYSAYGYTAHCPVSGSYTHTFTQLGDTLLNADFALHTVPIQNIGVWLSSSASRPGFPMTYSLTYYNNGNVTVNNVVLSMNFNSMLSFVSATTAPSSSTSSSLTWNLGTLNPGVYGGVTITFNVPANAVIGNSLCANATITPLAGESYTYDNYAADCRVVQGSFDPNEKTANSSTLDPVAGTINSGDTVLTYTVNFQNTGTDTAFNIVVIDTLSTNLDPSTIEPGPSSDPYTMELSNGVMQFDFYNIYLPDSNRDEPNSHGWFQYRVRTQPTIGVGDVINNRADIYFDYNAPILTNTTSDTLISPAGIVVPDVAFEQFMLFPNPATESATIVLPQNFNGKDPEIMLTDAAGRIILQKTFTDQTLSLDLLNIESGIYFCTLKADGKIIGVQKLIKE